MATSSCWLRESLVAKPWKNGRGFIVIAGGACIKHHDLAPCSRISSQEISNLQKREATQRRSDETGVPKSYLPRDSVEIGAEVVQVAYSQIRGVERDLISSIHKDVESDGRRRIPTAARMPPLSCESQPIRMLDR